jgi:hypothetical protein
MGRFRWGPTGSHSPFQWCARRVHAADPRDLQGQEATRRQPSDTVWGARNEGVSGSNPLVGSAVSFCVRGLPRLPRCPPFRASGPVRGYDGFPSRPARALEGSPPPPGRPFRVPERGRTVALPRRTLAPLLRGRTSGRTIRCRPADRRAARPLVAGGPHDRQPGRRHGPAHPQDRPPAPSAEAACAPCGCTPAAASACVARTPGRGWAAHLVRTEPRRAARRRAPRRS